MGYVSLFQKGANDALAETRSRIKRMQAGDIPYNPSSLFGHGLDNPLTSPATSFGNVWFKPTKDGYTADEKYDFVYGAADKKMPMVPVPGGSVQLDPSQEAALTSAASIQGPQGTTTMGLSGHFAKDTIDKPAASAHPLTWFGRSIVMKMPDKSFTYPINIR